MKNKIIIMLFFSAFMTKAASTEPQRSNSTASSDTEETFEIPKTPPQADPLTNPSTTYETLLSAAALLGSAAKSLASGASALATAALAPASDVYDDRIHRLGEEIRTAAARANYAKLKTILDQRGPIEFYAAALIPSGDKFRAVETVCYVQGDTINCLELFASIKNGGLLCLNIREDDDNLLQALIRQEVAIPKPIFLKLLELGAPLESNNPKEKNVSFTLRDLLSKASGERKIYLESIASLIHAENSKRYHCSMLGVTNLKDVATQTDITVNPKATLETLSITASSAT